MSSQYYHSVRFAEERCCGTMHCLRVCPTQAIRVRRGRAVMLEDRCIDCGECIKSCRSGAAVPLTNSMGDLSRFERRIAIPSPALYAQFDPEVLPKTVLVALRLCGFDDAVSLADACDAMTVAVEVYLAQHQGQYPLISSFCPTVVRLVQSRYPALVGQLLPILPPREITARDVKARIARETGIAPDRIGAIYITPCPAKMISIVDHPGMKHSHLDAAVAIAELYQPLSAAIAEVRNEAANMEETETASCLSWALRGGLQRTLPAERTLPVTGLPNVIRILDDIEKGKLRDYTFVECNACPEGCVSGSLTVENPYVARAKVIRLMAALRQEAPQSRRGIARRVEVGDFLMSEHPLPRPSRPLDQDISIAIAKMRERDGIVARLPGIDCTACGAPSCQAFAEDVVLGEADERQCPFKWQEQVVGQVTDLMSLVEGCTRRSVRPAPGGQP